MHWSLSLAEIAAFRLERIFQPMTALEFITGRVVYRGQSPSILLFESISVLWMLQQTKSWPNHTSYRKFYFN